MIVKAYLPVNFVTTYHTEHENEEQVKTSVERIRSTEVYKRTKESIKKNGVLDPVIAMVTPIRRCMVEIGEQRVLIARELGIEELLAIVYTKNGGRINFGFEERLKSLDEISTLFGTKDPPGLKTITSYVKSGNIAF